MHLSSFMVRYLYERRGPSEALNPRLFFADVMESIDGRRDPLPATESGWICMDDGGMPWLQFPSNINITYNVYNV